ncbi:hypothetical protein BBAD15_g12238 [Beauveria bassiana D1-5]|uniref:HAT C-terminal dimerisation domain-containing protein n=1 Tax=Beauveria bassiana D1-5 TaxID=1245745 RepID=A0A0A2V424_BEABA|nr:hypothetical protein BBAD15_g12238 [Beauveria bassiana D1-5]
MPEAMSTHPFFRPYGAALDPLQQARRRRQRLAATMASGSLETKRIKLTSELDEFMARANRADVEVEDPLEWWVAHAADYPILSKMAFDLFSCPAMSAECERVFSQRRSSLMNGIVFNRTLLQRLHAKNVCFGLVFCHRIAYFGIAVKQYQPSKDLS